MLVLATPAKISKLTKMQISEEVSANSEYVYILTDPPQNQILGWVVLLQLFSKMIFQTASGQASSQRAFVSCSNTHSSHERFCPLLKSLSNLEFEKIAGSGH